MLQELQLQFYSYYISQVTLITHVILNTEPSVQVGLLVLIDQMDKSHITYISLARSYNLFNKLLPPISILL